MPKFVNVIPAKFKKNQKITYKIGCSDISATIQTVEDGGESVRGKQYPPRYELVHASGRTCWRDEGSLTPA